MVGYNTLIDQVLQQQFGQQTPQTGLSGIGRVMQTPSIDDMLMQQQMGQTPPIVEPQQRQPEQGFLDKIRSNPAIASALIRFGATALEASGSGMSDVGAIGRAAGAGLTTFDEQRQQQAAARQAQLEAAVQQRQQNFENMLALMGERRAGQEAERLASKDLREAGKTELEMETEKLRQSKLSAETRKLIKETETSGQPDFEKLVEVENKLRDDYNKQAEPFYKAREAHNRVLASADNPSAAGDLALIFNYMKVLDPGSVVREGEFANAQNSAGVPDAIRAKYNQIIRGERLAPEQRRDFVMRSQKLFETAAEDNVALANEFKRIAISSQARPENVVIDLPQLKTANDINLGLLSPDEMSELQMLEQLEAQQ